MPLTFQQICATDNYPFIDKLHDRQLEYIVNTPVVEGRVPLNVNRFIDLVHRIVQNNLKVYIDPDCDPDGLFSGLIIKKMFDRIPYDNYVVGKHLKKRHGLDEPYLVSLIQSGFDVVIILDSSSNELSNIKFLTDNGVEVAIIDHHNTDNIFRDYPEDCIIINPKIDSRFKTAEYSELSAGAICALVADCTLSAGFDKIYNDDLYLYGYITLYSDSCDMSNLYNINYIKAYRNSQELPKLISMFMTKYDSFNRNFISWRMVPRINALIRNEHFDFLYKLFYDDSYLVTNADSAMQYIDSVYNSTKDQKRVLADLCSIDDRFKNIVVGILPLDGEPIRSNYTGLVASMLAERYDKAAICLVRIDSNTYRGSCRDRFSRDLQSTFKNYCYAKGHGPAFGIEIPVYELESVLQNIDKHDEIFTEHANSIFVNWDNMNRDSDDVYAEAEQMADYNEFSGNNLPEAYIVTTITDKYRITQTRYGQKATVAGRFCFESFKWPLHTGDLVMVRPTLGKDQIKFTVEGVF